MTLKIEEKSVIPAASNATNATATASMGAAGAGYRWKIMGWGASFSGAAVSTPVLSTTTIAGVAITAGVSTNGDGWHVALDSPMDSEENGNPSCALVAGGAGAVGRVYIYGYKVGVSE